MPKIDAPELKTKDQERVYVTVPDMDLFDMTHPSIIINGRVFGPGKHYVDPVIASTIEERIKLFRDGQVRLLQPKSDKKALDAMNRSGAAKQIGGQNASPDSPEFS